ncbi:FmdB family zinc ribbon protein [Methylophaga sp. OBS1]|uniref:FmdB family zinc ribbon protein n=1 Tax=Methylophaga sp. OBS1 TaxID=2991933 RepID=UPI00225A881F|nr:zinc ribbon domain-containing protein [Methylophaga sp. OBS1]MCX4191364.1 zinc ribbon domain-containing protein [Methylophaga sp. OBS1]MCX4191690.1 zinc ribbon domain-containing protein [Methylophaga sp. OBS1]
MPLYDYRCDSCGSFSAMQKMSQSSAPAVCPACGAMADRIISAPRLALMDRGTRTAMERNEASAHAPRHARRSSCGCSGTHTCSTTARASAKQQTEKPGLQMQTKKTARPWMLGH